MSVHIANQIIKKEWTDYNNHMNMAYYILVFDQVWELMLEKFKMGEMSAKTTSMSTMVVETHTTYNSEVKEGDEVEVNLTFFDHDKKRLHYKMEMIEKSSKKLSATTEVLSLYINLDARKVSEFEEEKVNLMDDFINLNSLKFSNKDVLEKKVNDSFVEAANLLRSYKTDLSGELKKLASETDGDKTKKQNILSRMLEILGSKD